MNIIREETISLNVAQPIMDTIHAKVDLVMFKSVAASTHNIIDRITGPLKFQMNSWLREK